MSIKKVLIFLCNLLKKFGKEYQLENPSYELELVPIKIKNNRIGLWTVKRWKEAIEDGYVNENDYIHNFPLWIKIWEASIVLSDHLAQAALDKTKEILELGAGMGLTGITLGVMGYPVTVTDHNADALAMIKKNVEHNHLNNVHVDKLDWLEVYSGKKYDIVCGSELIYTEDVIDPLLDLLQKCLEHQGRAFIAHDINRKNMETFLQKAETIFHIDSQLKSLKTNTNVSRIVVHTIRFK